MILGRLHHFLHTRCIADIARIDAQARSARHRRFNAAAIVEVYVSDERNFGFTRYLGERSGGILVRTRDPDDIGAGFFEAADLIDGGRRIRGRRVSHRLDGDRRVATDLDITHADLARLAALNLPPGADVVQVAVCAVHETRFLSGSEIAWPTLS